MVCLFVFLFFVFGRICGFAIICNLLGLLPFVIRGFAFVICGFATIYNLFILMLGFFSLVGLPCYIFFFQILVQKFFFGLFFFCLKVEQIILFIYLRVFLIFCKGKQIKNFKLLYIIFVFLFSLGQGVPKNTLN